MQQVVRRRRRSAQRRQNRTLGAGCNALSWWRGGRGLQSGGDTIISFELLADGHRVIEANPKPNPNPSQMKRGGPSSMKSAVCSRHRRCRRPEAGGDGRVRSLARPRLRKGPRTSRRCRRNENEATCHALQLVVALQNATTSKLAFYGSRGDTRTNHSWRLICGSLCGTHSFFAFVR